VEQVVPDNLDLRLAFFIRGFSSSRGKVVSLEYLENWLKERIERARAAGVTTPG